MWTGLTPTPDPGFVRKLHEYDPSLGIEFNRELERFVVTQVGKISGRVVMLVVDDPQLPHYRQPDERELAQIWLADKYRSWRHGYKEAMIEGEQKMIDQRKKFMRDAEDDIKALGRENKTQISNAYRKALNNGKTESQFRRVQPKPRHNPAMGRHVTSY